MLHRLWNQLRLIHQQMYYLYLNLIHQFLGLSQLMTNPIFATRYWINILIYIENVVVKISIIMGLLMRHHAGSRERPSAQYANLGHDDEEIEGRYKAGSYFIKCEQREIEIVA